MVTNKILFQEDMFHKSLTAMLICLDGGCIVLLVEAAHSSQKGVLERLVSWLPEGRNISYLKIKSVLI